MAGGLTLIPSYTSDNVFPAYQDRLLIKSLGVQAGVAESEDYKVSAGSGLQVNVKAGKAFVEQTKAIEESNNTFYNGLYNVLNPTEQNPYNSVEVSAVNPQIAQIILRVYDIAELGISGSSYARLEWLNGAPNAGATKAHVEEGKASEFGAAALPQSSFRCAYIVVPKNATVSSEYSIIDARKYIATGAWLSPALGSHVEKGSIGHQEIGGRTIQGGAKVEFRGNIKLTSEVKTSEALLTFPEALWPKSFHWCIAWQTGTGSPILLSFRSNGEVKSELANLISSAEVGFDNLGYNLT